MTRARHQLIDLSATSYYHVINRCVRRSFLCGDDPYIKRNYDHRRQWLVDRIKLLSSIFSINIVKMLGKKCDTQKFLAKNRFCFKWKKGQAQIYH